MAASEQLNSCGVVCIDSWQRLELRCILSGKRLTDPAKTDATGCRCLARCNYEQLSDYATTIYVRKVRKCPECMRHTRGTRGVVRDNALRALLPDVPADVEKVWVRDGKLRVDDPSSPTAPGGHRSRGKRVRNTDGVPLLARTSKRLSAAFGVKVEST